jgi:alkanesulfonate monooxygenase SsuD/methylene tetrahydromethanopterin reductase-like flavin-dependent oxidoreductase (luciferase family)
MTADDVSYDGRHYRLDHATYDPKPVQRPHPPVWIGASGERLMLPIVARQADVWHHSGPLEEMLRKSRLIDELARQYGRDPAAIARAGSIRLDDDRDTIRRTAEAFRAAGFSHLVCVWPADGVSRVEAFARDLLPELQAL